MAPSQKSTKPGDCCCRLRLAFAGSAAHLPLTWKTAPANSTFSMFRLELHHLVFGENAFWWVSGRCASAQPAGVRFRVRQAVLLMFENPCARSSIPTRVISLTVGLAGIIQKFDLAGGDCCPTWPALKIEGFSRISKPSRRRCGTSNLPTPSRTPHGYSKPRSSTSASIFLTARWKFGNMVVPGADWKTGVRTGSPDSKTARRAGLGIEFA